MTKNQSRFWKILNPKSIVFFRGICLWHRSCSPFSSVEEEFRNDNNECSPKETGKDTKTKSSHNTQDYNPIIDELESRTRKTIMTRITMICNSFRNRSAAKALESFHRTPRCHSSTNTKTNKAPPDIKIVEVGPRDGLQNEPLPLVSVQDKLEFIRKLEQAGCSNIEVGSFVSPKWIPQMSGSADVLAGVLNRTDSHSQYSVLVPNLKGLQQVMFVEDHSIQNGGSPLDEIAIFGAASEEFTKRNINSTIEESLQRFRDIIDRLHQNRDSPAPLVRGYVSTVIACPYQGATEPKKVAEVVEKMLDLGCHEVSLGDTIGVGTPESTRRMLDEVLVRFSLERSVCVLSDASLTLFLQFCILVCQNQSTPDQTIAKPTQLAMHCHDTYGQALVNILTGLEKEIYTIDSSLAGLGGCPYAKGASGNVATEDVLYML